VGFDNFKYLFSVDAFTITKNALLMNGIFIVSLLVISLLFALLLFEVGNKYVKVYQTAFFFPYFISWVVASYVFLGLFDMEYGLLNSIIKIFGGESVLWYNEPNYWIFILPLANVWKNAGYNAVIYYAALMGIDSEYYEAADLDGASRWQKIKHISIPLITPLIVIMVILQIGRIFYSDFGLFYNLTLDSSMLYPVTDVIDTYVYRALRKSGDIGMASAAGLYQSIIGFIMVFVTNWLVKLKNPENALF
jgi:putative aldouronate transport system permease protein